MRTRVFYLIALITQTKAIIMNDEKYEKAKKRVEELKKFYGNLVTYILINIMLVIINLVTNPGNLWFYWVTIFWGIGILLHASKVFVLKGKFLGEEWEEKKIKQIMKKDN
jgi:tellurite resistance protein TehA-like permease